MIVFSIYIFSVLAVLLALHTSLFEFVGIDRSDFYVSFAPLLNTILFVAALYRILFLLLEKWQKRQGRIKITKIYNGYRIFVSEEEFIIKEDELFK